MRLNGLIFKIKFGLFIMSDILTTIVDRYANFSMTDDRAPEIVSLRYLSFENSFPDPDASSRLVIVLVEPRLIEAGDDANLQAELINSLLRYKADLRAEGLMSRFILADVYKGSIHKDGQTVLAIRHFFKAVRASFPNFEGAVLIGNFPEATLVRKVCWAPSDVQLAIASEIISERSEIVMADLSGNWDTLYRRADFSEQLISARPDAATTRRGWKSGEEVLTCEFTSSDFEIRDTGPNAGPYRDAFFLNDAIYTIVENRAVPTPFLKLRINSGERNNEVALEDRSVTNIISKPEISISRINAYHIAMNPDPSLVGADGNRFLDGSGNPQEVRNPTRLIDDFHESMFPRKDFNFERRILIRYFKRNHKFRVGSFSKLPFRTAAISGAAEFNPVYYAGLLNQAASDFLPAVTIPTANLNQYVEFLKTPAVLKYIIAHSSPLISDFQALTNAVDYTNLCGGLPFRWLYLSGAHKPTFQGQGGMADIYTHRTLWHYKTLENSGASIIIHGGCNVNSINETQSNTYNDLRYGMWSNSEGILFFTNCVTIFSRAKGFNDSPNGFADGFRLADRANLGSCWRSYFNNISNDASLTTFNIQRKRPYFWSMNGDWTVRLRNANGLGVIGFDTTFNSREVHPNKAWIDGWNFDGRVNRIRGVGDFDGDGNDEFIVTSEWGIGIIKYNGNHFRASMIAPRDTRFGDWRYDATINSGRDLIKATGKFTQNAKSEILIWSSWGMATLLYNDGNFRHSRIFANGSRLGGWVLNTADNSFAGVGNFDRDNRKDMVLTSPWGIGIISLNNIAPVFAAPNGTRFGGWLLNTRDNQIQLIADFDGDGMDEFLVTSPWGIGILKMTSGALSSVVMYANGSTIGSYVVNNTDSFCIADKFRGASKYGILVSSRNGLDCLELSGDRIAQVASVRNGIRVDGWILDTSSNRFQAVGDMNADNRAEFFVRSPWGIGLFHVSPSNQFRCLTLVPFDSMLNDWYLQSTDVMLGYGKFSTSMPSKTSLLFLKQ
jgi:hypothetical protein